MILRKSPRVPAIVTGGQDTVGLRCPSHPVAQALLREFAKAGSGAVAAPSANRFGHVSPTTAQHVRDEFGPRPPRARRRRLRGRAGIDDRGPVARRARPPSARRGDARGHRPRCWAWRPATATPRPPGPRGRSPSHYAPRTPVALVRTADLDRRVRAELAAGRSLAVLARCPWPGAMREVARVWWHAAPEEAARLRPRPLREPARARRERAPTSSLSNRLPTAPRGKRFATGSSGPPAGTDEDDEP